MAIIIVPTIVGLLLLVALVRHCRREKGPEYTDDDINTGPRESSIVVGVMYDNPAFSLEKSENLYGHDVDDSSVPPLPKPVIVGPYEEIDPGHLPASEAAPHVSSTALSPVAASARRGDGGRSVVKAWLSWVEETPISRDAAERALKRGGRGTGSYCFRNGKDGGLVLVVRNINGTPTHFRIAQLGGLISLPESEYIEKFDDISAMLAHHTLHPVSTNVPRLTECIPFVVANLDVNTPKPARRKLTRSTPDGDAVEPSGGRADGPGNHTPLRPVNQSSTPLASPQSIAVYSSLTPDQVAAQQAAAAQQYALPRDGNKQYDTVDTSTMVASAPSGEYDDFEERSAAPPEYATHVPPASNA